MLKIIQKDKTVLWKEFVLYLFVLQKDNFLVICNAHFSMNVLSFHLKFGCDMVVKASNGSIEINHSNES